ncbi:MAG TPA: AI-2E family transporter [Actinomycetota bacterium]|nr:AI-2E family transporter [Actinomycetota bacterium]
MSSPPTPRLPAGERLRRAGVGAWSIIGILILAAAFVWVLFKIRIIFPPLVLALLIIYLLNPLVTRLEERNVSRTIGTILAYVVVLGGITLLIIGATPYVSRQIDTFRDDWPEFKVELADSIVGAGDEINDRFGIDLDTSRVTCLLDADDTAEIDAPSHERCDEVTQRFRESITASADRITEVGSSVLEVLFIFILGPLLALYLLIDLPQLQRDLLNLVPESHKEEMADLGAKVGKTIGGFFRGQFLVALIVGIMSAIGFAIIDLKFWLVIGAIAGFTNLIPLVGPFIGGGLGLLIGSITGGAGLGLKAALVALIVQQIDNHIISPNVMKRTVQLHPVSVMLSILAGGTLAGFWGVLLGVPAVAVGKLLFNHLWTTRVLGVEPSPFAPLPGTEPPSVVPEEPDVASSPPHEGSSSPPAESGEGNPDAKRGRFRKRSP